MTFNEVLSQTIAMLHQHGRVSYRALKRQFALQDDSLEDLTDAILFAHPQVRDEEGCGLVWTGASPTAAPAPRPQPEAERPLDAVLLGVMALLQREQRVTYRTLRAVFGVDEAYLHAVRDELHFRQLACEEGGQGLVWTGTDAPESRATALPPALDGVSSRPVDDGVASLPDDMPARTPALARSAPEAERRHLTVMFCDLVDSTHLSRQLDPEDYRAVVRAYQEAATAVLQCFDGYMAQYLGDGLLVYFGYPYAHEDEAQRAVQAGLELVEAIAPLNTRLEPQYGVRVAVRVGLHTGLVVMGAMGGGQRQEQLAMGDTPNIAARLQGLATPNTVVLSAVTARLVHEAFALEERGLHHVKGMAEPLAVYRVLGLQEVPGDEEEAGPARVPVLVGRDEEVGLLRRRWEQSKAGLGQVVLLSGEAGIGKSALMQTLREHVGREGGTRLTFRCSSYHTSSALAPVIAHFQRLLRWEHDEAPEARLVTLERVLAAARQPLAEVVPLLAALLAVPLPEGRYAARTLTPQQQRQQTLDTLVALLLAEAEQQPVLAVYEDLHWADPSTLELLGALLEQAPTVPMLTVLTFRPVFVPPWPSRSHLTPITLNRLERLQVEALMTHVAGGKALPAEVMAHIVAKTDGVPLFVEELTKMLLESDLLREETQHYALTGPLTVMTIPATLQDSLMARLDRLGAAKDVAQLGAVVGREFAYEVLQALASLDEATLQARLTQLVEAELLYQRGRPPRARYVFKHALIQDAAYASLLKRTRQQVHQQIAEVLETQFPALVETQPELLAQHYTAAGLAGQAMPHWQRAGERAIERSAYVEAISHLTTALEVLQTLPDTPERLQQELDVSIALGIPLVLTKGHAAPEVEATYARARALCRQLGDTPQLFAALLGLRRFSFMRGALQTAHDLGEQLLRLAERLDDRGLRVRAHQMLAEGLLFLGAFAQARAHAEQGISLYDPQQHRAQVFRYGNDAGVGCRAFAAEVLWVLGYPDQALRRIDDALTWAQELSHPFSLAFALNIAARLHRFRREPHNVQARADAGIALARAHGFRQFLATASMLRGWALAAQGQREDGLAELRQGMADRGATGAQRRPSTLLWLADVYGHLGQPDEGHRVLAEAETAAQASGERYYEAELYRLQGALALQAGVRPPPSALPSPQPPPPSPHAEADAEAYFHKALEIARRQEAKSWELRAAMSLSRLWQQQGKQAEAHALLAPVYAWFTEGFDTADLREAQVLLEALT